MNARIAVAFVAGIAASTAHALAYPQLGVPQTGDPPLDPAAPSTAWSNAASCTLPWNAVQSKPASESTKAWISTDGHALYVRFEVHQHEPIVALQHTNDVGQGSDDQVWVDLWPNGISGYFYQFYSTPNGTHYQYSSENTGYSPTWESHGAVHGDGYTVTMKIPLDVIRNAHGGTWKAQFVRYVRSTGEQQVWSYDRVQMQPDSYGNADYAHAGSITLPQLKVGMSRPKPRAAIYALAEAASKSIGGSTSRMGADLSIPITPTASFYSTFHPDYSNVELDQQTIAPTVYQRYYNEVRPFFTQAASFYNQFNCNVCQNIQSLYTPAIPTPREGYAVEGKQGPIGFATFDSIGDNDRNDLASALNFTSASTMWNASVQRVAVTEPGFIDVATEAGVNYYDLKHISAYVNYGNVSGTNVLTPNQAQYYEFGGGWANQTLGFFGSTRKIGEYFNPADGFISHTGIAGYALYAAKIWDFSPNDKLVSAGIAGLVDRYQGPTMGQAQSDNSLLFDILTKSKLDLQVFSGSNYWRFGDVLTPITQNAGFQFTYDSGLQTNNPGQFPYHGASATPTTISYNTGRYGTGRLDTWFRTTTIRVGNHGALSLALDDTAQYEPVGQSKIQWFESVSYAYQIGPNSSFAIGLRRVVGYPPIPNGGGNCMGTCSNVSIAYHLRLRNSEIYLAYGNPNALTTVPQAIFKVIFYAGAQKGT